MAFPVIKLAIGKELGSLADKNGVKAIQELRDAASAGVGFVEYIWPKQTSAATLEIKEKIENIQGSTDGTVRGINEISEVINNVNEIVSTIATAVEEQSAATREIAATIAQASQGIQEVNENLNQSSTVAGEITQEPSNAWLKSSIRLWAVLRSDHFICKVNAPTRGDLMVQPAGNLLFPAGWTAFFRVNHPISIATTTPGRASILDGRAPFPKICIPTIGVDTRPIPGQHACRMFRPVSDQPTGGVSLPFEPRRLAGDLLRCQQ